jgi:hypothetical protein
LEKDQADWVSRVPTGPDVAVLVRPVTVKQLQQKLMELAPLAKGEAVSG